MRLFIVLTVVLVLAPNLRSNADSLDGLLAEYDLQPTTESLGPFFRSLMDDNDNRLRYAAMIADLGADSFSTRERATKRLLNSRVVHFDLLERALKSEDAEIRVRVESIIEQLKQRPPNQRRDDALNAALMAVKGRRIPGLVEPMIALLPRITQPLIQQRARQGLVASVRMQDMPLVRQSLKNQSGEIRLAAIHMAERLLGRESVSLVVDRLDDPHEPVRFAAALVLANVGDHRALNVLGGLLESNNASIRARSVHALRQLSGQQFGFTSCANEDEREEAIAKWNRWINGPGRTAQLVFPIAPLTIDTEGLVLHFTFDKAGRQATDVSGNKNDGTIVNATHAKDGFAGGGCKLDGRGDYITVPNSDSLEIRDRLTVAVWVRFKSFGPGGYGNEEGHIIKKGDPLWWNPAFGMAYRKKNRIVRFVIGHPVKPSRNGAGKAAHSKTVLEANRWYHLAGTYDGKNVRLYVDGRLESTEPYVSKIRGDRAPVMLGGGKLFSKSAYANHFAVDGTIDDVRLYNRALSADEVGMLVQR